MLSSTVFKSQVAIIALRILRPTLNSSNGHTNSVTRSKAHTHTGTMLCLVQQIIHRRKDERLHIFIRRISSTVTQLLFRPYFSLTFRLLFLYSYSKRLNGHAYSMTRFNAKTTTTLCVASVRHSTDERIRISFRRPAARDHPPLRPIKHIPPKRSTC